MTTNHPKAASRRSKDAMLAAAPIDGTSDDQNVARLGPERVTRIRPGRGATRIMQSLGVLAAAALMVAGISAGSALAATHSAAPTKRQWQADIAHVRRPGTGCYRASYPALTWHATRCVRAPRIPLAPVPLPRVSRHGGPATVGNTSGDYSAQVNGLISQATGTFTDVSPGITEQGQPGGTGPLTANAFSLQLNSQFFSGSPACDGSANPSSCQAWQQFVYTYGTSTTSFVFMQYWLLNYNAACPLDWQSDDSGDCFIDSQAVSTATLTASQLSAVQLSGSAASGSTDGVSLSVGSGQAAAVTNTDSVLDLAANWNTTEWGVYGDGHGSAATFGPGTTLTAQTALTATTSAAPECVAEDFTGETNNLSLTSTPALGIEASPTIASEQTNGATGTPGCSYASGGGSDVTYAPGSNGALQDLFARDSVGLVYRAAENSSGSWSWSALPLALYFVASDITYAPGSNGALQELFFHDGVGCVSEAIENSNGSWNGWAYLGCNVAGDITYAPGSNGSVQELFARNAAGTVYADWENSNGSWNGWVSLGAMP
jgi:hypothetical protein